MISLAEIPIPLPNFSLEKSIFELWKALLIDDNIVFSTIVAPITPIAGIGLLWTSIPIFLTLNERGIKSNALAIIRIFFIMILFLNNASAGKFYTVGTYAIIKGMDRAINTGMQQVANISEIAKDLTGDQKAVSEIQKLAKDCVQIAPELPSGQPNPAALQCSQDLKANVQQRVSSGEIKDPNLLGSLTGSFSKGDLLGVGSAVLQIGGKFVKDAAQAPAKVFFAAWRMVILYFGDIALLFAGLSFPIYLALSFFNSDPLMRWHGSVVSVAIFMIGMTIIEGMSKILNAKLGGSIPLHFMDLFAGIAAPVAVGFFAKAGGMGVYDALFRALSTVASTTGEVGKMIIKR
jgi:hypothetical protein